APVADPEKVRVHVDQDPGGLAAAARRRGDGSGRGPDRSTAKEAEEGPPGGSHRAPPARRVSHHQTAVCRRKPVTAAATMTAKSPFVPGRRPHSVAVSAVATVVGRPPVSSHTQHRANSQSGAPKFPRRMVKAPTARLTVFNPSPAMATTTNTLGLWDRKSAMECGDLSPLPRTTAATSRRTPKRLPLFICTSPRRRLRRLALLIPTQTLGRHAAAPSAKSAERP